MHDMSYEKERDMGFGAGLSFSCGASHHLLPVYWTSAVLLSLRHAKAWAGALRVFFISF